MATGAVVLRVGAIKDSLAEAARAGQRVVPETLKVGAAGEDRSAIFLRAAAGILNSHVPSPLLCPRWMCSFAPKSRASIPSPGKSR